MSKSKLLISFLAIIGLAILGGLFMSNDDSNNDHAETNDTETVNDTIAYDEVVAAAREDGAAFIDVRTPEEFYESHFPEAELFPLQLLQQSELPDYDPEETTLYVYCRTGNRTVEAVRILREAGFNAINLGGLNDVEAVGGELNDDTCPLGDTRLCIDEFYQKHDSA